MELFGANRFGTIGEFWNALEEGEFNSRQWDARDENEAGKDIVILRVTVIPFECERKNDCWISLTFRMYGWHRNWNNIYTKIEGTYPKQVIEALNPFMKNYNKPPIFVVITEETSTVYI